MPEYYASEITIEVIVSVRLAGVKAPLTRFCSGSFGDSTRRHQKRWFGDTSDRNQRYRQRLANERSYSHVIKQGPEKRQNGSFLTQRSPSTPDS
jgi:hypothetical protein